jgi:O-antigen/teichoic acid export membrane protein
VRSAGRSRSEVKGWYTAALNLARLPNLLAFVATSILVPTIARALGAGDRAAALRALRGGTTALLALLVPMLAVGTIEARGLLELLFSEAYGGGAPLLAVLLAAHGVLYTGFVTLGSVLLAAGRERISALIAPAAAAAALLFLPLGTVLAGALGTALGALATGLSPAVLRAGPSAGWSGRSSTSAPSPAFCSRPVPSRSSSCSCRGVVFGSWPSSRSPASFTWDSLP